MWDRLYQLKQDGVTIVLTTHYMDEAEQLCDRLVIMDEARIVDEGSPRELIERHATPEVVEMRFPDPTERAAALDASGRSGDRAEEVAERILVYTDDGDSFVAKLIDDGHHPASVLVRRGTLEDVFLILTGRSLDD